jgi:hypothetical protein
MKFYLLNVGFHLNHLIVIEQVFVLSLWLDFHLDKVRPIKMLGRSLSFTVNPHVFDIHTGDALH